jgi:hypothetical protein
MGNNMQKKLISSSAIDPLGNPSGKKIFKIPSGPYTGRLVTLVQTSPSEIKLMFANSHCSSWSSGLTIVSDASDSHFAAEMDNFGNLFVVYTEQTTLYLVFKKLTFANGSWSIGSKVTIFNGTLCFNPSIALEPSGKIWVSWSRFTSPNKFIHIKSSTDSGASWGTGGNDSGQQLTTGDLSASSKIVLTNTHLHVVAIYGNSKIVMRSLPLSGGSWSDEMTIGTTTISISDEFDVAVGIDGRIAVVYNDTSFRYREFDNVNWGALVTLNQYPVISPQVIFRSNVPVVVFLDVFNGLQKIMKYTERRSGEFSTPVPLDNRARLFEKVLLYNQSASAYVDVTTAAESQGTGDIFHNQSSCLLKDVGDQLYLGMSVPFRYVHVLLSTPGVGGTLVFSYWDGTNFRAFTPSSGSTSFDSSMNKIVLWDDYHSIPSDWQKKGVDTHYLFWIKVEVSSAYNTGPVGTQITGISEISTIILRR